MLRASNVFLHATKYAILEKRSTTTMMESTPRLVLGKPKMKFKLKSSQMLRGMGKGVYTPVFCLLPLFTWQVW